MKNNSALEILEKLKSANNILITLHEGPDGDSLGSCGAMKYFLENKLNKKVTLISSDELNEQLKSFDFVKEIEFGKSLKDFDLNNFDLILFLDHGSLKYFGEIDFELPKGKVINIDHHQTNSYYGDLNYVLAEKCSACSVILDLFKKWDVEFDKELATRLLIGVYSDSGYFSHHPDAIKEGVYLIDKGADYIEGVVNKIKYNIPLKTKKYYAFITNKFRTQDVDGIKVGVSSVSVEEIEDLGLNLSEIRGGINYLQEIAGLDLLFTLVETEDIIKGSFRSRKKVDVSLIAKELGGGGHKFAAAFRLDKMPLDEAEKKVFEAIKKVGIHREE